MSDGDRMLEHSLVYAMIEIGVQAPLVASLEKAEGRAARAALMAIDQIGYGDQAFIKQVWAALLSDDQALVQAAADILSRHKDWASHEAIQLDQLWAAAEKREPVRQASAQVLAAWSGEPKIVQAIASRINAVAGRWIPLT